MAGQVAAGVPVRAEPPARLGRTPGEHIGEGAVDPGGRSQAADVLGERLVEQAHHRLLAGTGHLEQVRGGGVQQPVQLGRRDRTAAVGAGQIGPQAVAGQARTAGVGDRDEQFGRARRIGKPLQVVVHGGANGVGKRLALLPPRHGGVDHGAVPRPGPGGQAGDQETRPGHRGDRRRDPRGGFRVGPVRARGPQGAVQPQRTGRVAHQVVDQEQPGIIQIEGDRGGPERPQQPAALAATAADQHPGARVFGQGDEQVANAAERVVGRLVDRVHHKHPCGAVGQGADQLARRAGRDSQACSEPGGDLVQPQPAGAHRGAGPADRRSDRAVGTGFGAIGSRRAGDRWSGAEQTVPEPGIAQREQPGDQRGLTRAGAAGDNVQAVLAVRIRDPAGQLLARPVPPREVHARPTAPFHSAGPGIPVVGEFRVVADPPAQPGIEHRQVAPDHLGTNGESGPDGRIGLPRHHDPGDRAERLVPQRRAAEALVDQVPAAVGHQLEPLPHGRALDQARRPYPVVVAAREPAGPKPVPRGGRRCPHRGRADSGGERPGQLQQGQVTPVARGRRMPAARDHDGLGAGARHEREVHPEPGRAAGLPGRARAPR